MNKRSLNPINIDICWLAITIISILDYNESRHKNTQKSKYLFKMCNVTTERNLPGDEWSEETSVETENRET